MPLERHHTNKARGDGHHKALLDGGAGVGVASKRRRVATSRAVWLPVVAVRAHKEPKLGHPLACEETAGRVRQAGDTYGVSRSPTIASFNTLCGNAINRDRSTEQMHGQVSNQPLVLTRVHLYSQGIKLPECVSHVFSLRAPPPSGSKEAALGRTVLHLDGALSHHRRVGRGGGELGVHHIIVCQPQRSQAKRSWANASKRTSGARSMRARAMVFAAQLRVFVLVLLGATPDSITCRTRRTARHTSSDGAARGSIRSQDAMLSMVQSRSVPVAMWHKALNTASLCGLHAWGK